MIYSAGKEQEKLLKIEDSPPEWWYELTDEEKYNLLIELDQLLLIAIQANERQSNILLQAKMNIKDNSLILKDVFQPRCAVGIQSIIGIDKKLQRDLYLIFPFSFFLLNSRMQLDIIPAVKILDNFGGGIGLGLKFNF